ncbi:MAG: hypothetical protein WBA89_16080 [Microcoleus sp.]|uniref:hypothetical protein n=1 Tax=Microcoleus sp. TaxID=44472 RepID=UPI003C707DEC
MWVKIPGTKIDNRSIDLKLPPGEHNSPVHASRTIMLSQHLREILEFPEVEIIDESDTRSS